MSVILFFDDRYLSVRNNAFHQVGKATKANGSFYGDPDPKIFANIPNVFYHPKHQKYYMLTYGTHLEAFYPVVLLAESEDGIRWKASDTRDLIKLGKRLFDHQVLEPEQSGEFCLYEDQRASSDKRYKLLGIRHRQQGTGQQIESFMMTSPDGLQWTDCHRDWHPSPPDLGALTIYFCEQRQSYMILTRPKMVDRRVAVMETSDWRHFTPPEIVLSTDALDTPLCESYGMTTLPYENYYLALYWLFHPSAQQVNGGEGSPSHKYFDGYVDCQVAYSEDGKHYQRFLRDPIIPIGEPGEPDCGCIYPRWIRQDAQGDLLITACVYPYEHGNWRMFVNKDEPHPSICTYRVRKDGFCSLINGGGEALIGTRALLWKGGNLQVNMQCPTGEARVQLTDPSGQVIAGYSFEECIPCCEDAVNWQPSWIDKAHMEEMTGRRIRVEVRWKTGKLFALRGDFQLLIGPEIHD